MKPSHRLFGMLRDDDDFPAEYPLAAADPDVIEVARLIVDVAA